jgi:YVTN family beta-propeller protein
MTITHNIRLLATAAGLSALALGGAAAHSPSLRQATPLTESRLDRLPSGLAGFVFTADEAGASISGIDLSDGSVTTVSIPIAPHNVDLSADGRWLLAVGDPAGGDHEHGSGDGHDQGHGVSDGSEADGKIVILDPRDLAAGPVAAFPAGAHPAHVVTGETGAKAFVTLAGQDALAVIDIATGERLALIETGAYPHGLRLSPDGQELYVANVQDGSVSVIDAAQHTELARIPVGPTPVQVEFLPEGGSVFVSLRDANAVAAIDTATREVTARYEVGEWPIQLGATRDGARLLVANEGSAKQPSETVSIIDLETRAEARTVRTGAGPHGVAISPAGAWAFVTNIHENSVSMIDLSTDGVVAMFAVGAGPNGITLFGLDD